MKKLIEGLPHYRDKLPEEEVFNRFQEILTKVSCVSPAGYNVDGLTSFLKARTNKSQNKPDAELNEFEAVSYQIRGLMR